MLILVFPVQVLEDALVQQGELVAYIEKKKKKKNFFGFWLDTLFCFKDNRAADAILYEDIFVCNCDMIYQNWWREWYSAPMYTLLDFSIKLLV